LLLFTYLAIETKVVVKENKIEKINASRAM
jgi:hypothetical protein